MKIWLRIIAVNVRWTQLFIHALNVYLLRTYLIGTIPDTRDISMNNEGEVPVLSQIIFYGVEGTKCLSHR